MAPTIKPPMMAPGTDVKPPRISTGSAFSATSDRLNWTPSFDPQISPATRATSPATPQTMPQICRSEMPTESAVWWSSATALSARPIRVRWKNTASTATRMAAMMVANMSNLLMNMPASSNGMSSMIRSSPAAANMQPAPDPVRQKLRSSGWTNESQTPCETPSMKKLRPIVAMNRMICSWLISGRRTIRSIAMASVIITTRVITSERQKFIPPLDEPKSSAPGSNEAAATPSRIAAAPWEKLTPTASARNNIPATKIARHMLVSPAKTIASATIPAITIHISARLASFCVLNTRV